MLTSVISRLIQDEFEANIEKGSEIGMAFTLDLHIDYDREEDGYRYVDVLMFAPANYVKILARERWTVIPTGGDDYVEGETPWFKVGDHDSCWRDSLTQIFQTYGNDIITLRQSRLRDLETATDILPEGWRPHGPWYSIYDQTEALRRFTSSLDHAVIKHVREAAGPEVKVS